MMPQLIAGLSAQGGRASGRRSFSIICASAIAATIARPSFPAASSSASRSPAPSPMRRACFSPTSRPAISIRKPHSYVFDALEALVRQSGLAALIATHNHELARRMDRRVTIDDGKVVDF